MSESKIDPYAGRYKNIVIPSLTINDATSAIEFYKNAFGAELNYIIKYKNKIAHAEITIENTTLMISDEIYGDKAKSAKTIGDTPIQFYVYTKNVDEMIKKAVQFGATIIYPIQDQFYGDRTGAIIDPYGFKWTIATHIRDVEQDETQKGLEKVMSKQIGGNDIYYRKYMKYKLKYLDMRM
jgi:PhnB protein